MGAGSAKGLQPGHSNDDADRLSNASSTQWHSGDNSDSDDSDQKTKSDHNHHHKDHDNHKKHVKKTVNVEVTSSAQPETPHAAGAATTSNEGDGDSSDGKENGDHSGAEEKKEKEEVKKKSFFKFSRKKNEPEKADDSADESDDEGKKRKDSKKGNKKEGERTGFKLFGWRNKKNEEKDVELDKDIDDLEKTFDSLGIVGKNMWNEDNNKSKKTSDDLELLEPMRKRKNIKVRGGPRGMNGVVAGRNDMNNGRLPTTGGGSSGSRRTFRYSWETEQVNNKSVKHEDDEWEYKAVVIEGFDIDKFRKANKRDPMYDSASLPNAVGDDDFDGTGIRSPLRYDKSEQQILASIERDFTAN